MSQTPVPNVVPFPDAHESTRANVAREAMERVAVLRQEITNVIDALRDDEDRAQYKILRAWQRDCDHLAEMISTLLRPVEKSI